MLPYFMILPLWLLIAVVWPGVQSLHALLVKSEERKLWLMYWMLFVAGSYFLYFFEWLVKIPFLVLDFYVEIYYETQLLVVFYLVFPKTFGIEKVKAQIQANGPKAMAKVKEQCVPYATKAYEKFMGFAK
mmetsp:Transcript_17323/g.30828  ORF Transcript_17323/g.30828 Transcript_17323/m.30828 type:complete len:130 (+) Transcript_17323:82-471(+)